MQTLLTLSLGSYPVAISLWDLVLFFTLSSLGLATAYLQHPRMKAFILMLPLPFSIAILSIGKPLDVSNMTAFLVVLLYTHLVRILRHKLRIPILLSIILSAAAYCAVSIGLAQLLPRTPLAFWIAAVAVFSLGFIMLKFTPVKEEPAHRSPIPVYYKILITFFVVCLLVLLKKYLRGFMSAFPMVGVFASYEGRKSLWTNCRQIPIVMIGISPMIIIIYLLQNHLGLPLALLISWIYYLAFLVPYFIHTVRSSRLQACRSE